MQPNDDNTGMRIGPHPHGGDDWPHCMATIEPVKVAEKKWEYRFPVPIPEKLWEARALWPIGRHYWKHLLDRDGYVSGIETEVVDGYVEKIILEGRPPAMDGVLELDLNSPGPPVEPYEFSTGSMNREERILDDLVADDYDEHEGGTCWYCHERVLEGLEDCPDCGVKLSREAPTVGELVEKYGPDARVFVCFHDRSVSLNVRYTLDNEGLTKEQAEKQAKYDAEMAEYKVLKIQWDELAEKVTAYNAAENESDERAKLAELKAKYEKESN